MTCNDRNPWAGDIRCQRPSGHDGMHQVHELDWIHRWTDDCHHPADDCQPCTNPRRSA